MLLFFTAVFCFFILEIIYFRIADRFNIIDKPNQRSSHSQITLRGGGILFPLALIIGVAAFEPGLIYLAFGVFAIAAISFLDDVLTLNNKLRIAVHLVAVLAILYQVYLSTDTSLFLTPFSLLLLIPALIVIIGIINAYNFMDGINGITVLYSTVAIASIWLIQIRQSVQLLNEDIFCFLLAALAVFGFFNLRKRAKAFAGDVGSIAMALILSFLILKLMVETENLKWILLLGVYGLDAVATIICRIFRRENIFDAHRSHFYQYLANERKWPHVLISAIYAVAQILLNVCLVYAADELAYTFFVMLILAYASIRLIWEGKNRLFKVY
ncbi:glycosyl transferase family 4 [Pelobium manganitolerans]|uniref:glycosyl transferase family 4 n=1 Tax=Pelobium manganitolerans TaxID=1842495 RepID=UPI003FA3A2E8